MLLNSYVFPALGTACQWRIRHPLILLVQVACRSLLPLTAIAIHTARIA